MTVARPLPQARGEEKDYYVDLRAHRMPYYLCGLGEHTYARPQEFCPACGAAVMREWSSGKGVVYSFTTVERAGHPYFTDAVPYVIALVEFAEGFRSLADLILPPGVGPSIGQRVRVEFEDVTDDITLAHFVAAA